MEGWSSFTGDMQQFYGLDLSCLTSEYHREQNGYYTGTSAWSDVHPSQLAGPPSVFKEYDLLTVTLEELAAPIKVLSVRQSMSRFRSS